MTSENGNYLEYGDQARRFLEQAFEELERNDLRQASEKGWGAASQIVKAAAEERGLPHGSHALLFRTVNALIAETDDPELFDMFGAANHLHQNFYEGEYAGRIVGRALEQVSQFVDRVDGLLNGRNGASSACG